MQGVAGENERCVSVGCDQWEVSIVSGQVGVIRQYEVKNLGLKQIAQAVQTSDGLTVHTNSLSLSDHFTAPRKSHRRRIKI